MKALKNLTLGLIIGGLLGVAAGVNIGRDKPILSNPFQEKSVSSRFKDTSNEFLRQSGEAIEEAGKAFKDQFN